MACGIDAALGIVAMIGLGLEGKRVIVTGAAGGLGRAFAEAFADAGASVIASDLNARGADEAARIIKDRGGEALSFTVDVASEASTAALAAFAREKFGGLDFWSTMPRSTPGFPARALKEFPRPSGIGSCR